eukprot:349807-Amphidinium_carterae.1
MSSRLSRAGSTVASDDETRPACEGIVDMDAMLDQALEEVTKRLQKNRSRILPMLQMLRSQDQALGVAAGQKRKHSTLVDAGSRQPFHKSYHRLAQLCVEFKAEVISSCTVGRLSLEDLMLVEKTSKGSINHAFFLGVQCGPDTKWPKHGKDPSVLKVAFESMHVECGLLWSHLEIYKPKPGMALIEWHAWGVYSLAPEDADAKTQLVHRPTGTVAELGVTLTVTREALPRVLQKNFGEKEAQVINGAFQFRCVECFKDLRVTNGWPSQRSTERFNSACLRASGSDDASTTAPRTPIVQRASESSPGTSSADTPMSIAPPPPPSLDDLGVPEAQE